MLQLRLSVTLDCLIKTLQKGMNRLSTWGQPYPRGISMSVCDAKNPSLTTAAAAALSHDVATPDLGVALIRSSGASKPNAAGVCALQWEEALPLCCCTSLLPCCTL